MKNRLRLLPLMLALLLLPSACGAQAKPHTATVYTMDTVMNLTVYGEDAEAALADAEAELYRLDALLDRHNEASAVSAFNRSGATEDAELVSLVREALTLSQETNGAFDVTIAPVMDAWGFGGEAFRVPSGDELAAILTRVGSDKLRADETSAALTDGAQVDFGGLAKGYAGARLRAIYEAHGVTGTIDLGGDVCLVGSKPDGSAWRVAIQDPNDSAAYLGIMTAADAYVATSGVYERNFEQGGKVYHHLLDPATGHPAESGLVSATVVCGQGGAADALATAVFVLGAERALALRDALAGTCPVELLLVTDDGRVLYTEGLRDMFDYSAVENDYRYGELAG